MKLATFSVNGQQLVGALDGDDVVVLDVPNMRALFELGSPVQEYAEKLKTTRRFRLSEVSLKAPIIPKKFFHTAGNYAEHAQEGDRANWPHAIKPWIVFFQNVDAIIGPDAPVIYPEHLTEELDYELELAVVIAKSGKNFGVEEAKDYIGGYVIFNDITARDIQRREMESANFCFSKSIDTFCPIGPWIVTADEIPDPYNLALELRVNGEKRQVSNSSHMSVTIPQILAKFSPAGYSAGDIISTGTVSGVAAFSADPQAWYLKPGDLIEAEIEKIGVLRNRVISWKEGHGVDAPPRMRF
jgi:2-keto-4-pentenoate hydratase/2-oxohepta-3-ene-1,7-dioic acid hydratase in catechol pathway